MKKRWIICKAIEKITRSMTMQSMQRSQSIKKSSLTYMSTKWWLRMTTLPLLNLTSQRLVKSWLICKAWSTQESTWVETRWSTRTNTILTQRFQCAENKKLTRKRRPDWQKNLIEWRPNWMIFHTKTSTSSMNDFARILYLTGANSQSET